MILGLAVALAQEPADPEPFQLDFLPATPQPVPAPAPQPAPYPAPGTAPGTQPAPYPAPGTQPAPYPAPGTQPAPYPAPYPAPAAQPYDPSAPVAPVPVVQLRTNDPVFLAPLQPTDGSLDAEAQRLTQVLRTHLSQYYPIVGIEAVPPWPDYSALIYVMACPPGHYTGCALVCGNRVNSTWTVGGTVSRTGTGVNVDLVFIGNESSRELLQFGVALNGGNDIVLGSSADTILKKIVDGAFDEVDLRLLEGDPREQEKLKKAQNDVLAASLAELEQSQGAVQRNDLEVKQGKLTKAELDKIRAAEQVKPWEAVGMSQSEYRRYRNSGRSLDDWKRLRRGRFGQVIARIGIGGGLGPYGQYFDGRYAVEGPEVRELQQYQFVGQAPHFMGDFELGFGVLPFLDITGHYAQRMGRFRYQINQEQVGNPVIVDDPVQRSIGSWSVGARAAFVPFQVSPIRPALHAGILYWQGKTWQKVFGLATFQEMKNMSLIAAQVGPGVELRTGRYLDIFARGLVDIPLAGTRSESYIEGGSTLQEPAEFTYSASGGSVKAIDGYKLATMGFTFQIGVVGKLSLIQGGGAKRGSSMRFEEEDEGL